MADEPKKPFKFTPAPNNIRVNHPKELRGKLDYDSLPPEDKVAIDSAAREWIAYCLTLPEFSRFRKRFGKHFDRGLDSTGTEDVTADE